MRVPMRANTRQGVCLHYSLIPRANEISELRKILTSFFTYPLVDRTGVDSRPVNVSRAAWMKGVFRLRTFPLLPLMSERFVLRF